MFPIEVLMETVVISFSVFEEQRCRQNLPRIVAALDEISVSFRIADFDAHRGAPTVGDGHKTRVESAAELGDDIGQGIPEVLVFSPAEAMSRHDHAAAKEGIVRIELG